jgi:hypothetical protein
MPIDTLDNVKTALGVTGTGDDALLEQLRAAAEGFVEQHCGRAFAGGSFTEYHPGGGRTLFLCNFPVSAVTAVRVDPAEGFGPETTRSPSSYTVHPDRGVIVSKDGPFVPPRPGFRVGPDDFPRAVRVEYSTPSGAVPAAVCCAYTDLIGCWFRQAKTHAHLGQLNVLSRNESGVETAYPWGLAGGFAIPEGVLQLLNVYRVPAA